MEQTALRGYIGGIQRFSTSDGPGIRTTVFLKGCPLRCSWCHNPELIGFGPGITRSENRCIACGACVAACPRNAVSLEGGVFRLDHGRCDRCMACTEACYARALRSVARHMSVEEVMAVVVRDRSYYDESGGGVTVSGGELLSQPAFTKALIRACSEEGLTSAVDTSGFGDGDTLHELARLCDYVLFDVKSGLEETHRTFTGVSLVPIRDNLRRLAADPATAGKIHLRMPLISDVNDTDEDIDATCKFLTGLGLRQATLLPYHELGISKSRGLGEEVRRFSAPAPERMHQIRERLAGLGIRAAIGGEDA